MDMWVPLKKKDKHLNQTETDRVREVRENFFFFFFRSSFLSQIYGNWTIGIRRIKTKLLYATKATSGYQKHGILQRIQVKIIIFSFSHIYGVLMV